MATVALPCGASAIVHSPWSDNAEVNLPNTSFLAGVCKLGDITAQNVGMVIESTCAFFAPQLREIVATHVTANASQLHETQSSVAPPRATLN
jgi:hypothetical protein